MKQNPGATLQKGTKESFKSQTCRQSLLTVGKGKLVARTPDRKQVLWRTMMYHRHHAEKGSK